MPFRIDSVFAPFLRQQERWVLWTPAALGLGIGGYFSLPSELPLGVGVEAILVLLLLVTPFYRNKTAFLLWLPVFLVVLGFTAAQYRTRAAGSPLLLHKTYPMLLEGQVTSAETMPQGYRFVLDQVQYKNLKFLPRHPFPVRVRLTSRAHTLPPHEGDLVRVKAALLPLAPPVIPGGYDFQRKEFFEGLGATGYTVGAVEVVEARGESSFFVAALRRYIYRHITAAIDDKDAASMVAGIMIGESKSLSAGAWDRIRLSGLAHLLSIAGLHTGVVTGWLFFLVRYFLAAVPVLALRYPIKKISAVIAMAGALFYLCLVHFFLPAERAVIMVCAVMTAIIFDRDPFSLRMLAFAAVIILLLRPESLVGVSFQMSFAAVSVLIAFYEGTRDWWSRLYQDKRWFMRIALFVLGSVATTFCATVGTAPYALFHFLRVPLISGFIANLIAVPIVVAVTLPLGMISCFLMPFGLETWFLKITGWSALAILKTAEITSQFPYAAYHSDSWPLSLLVLMTAGGLWLCIWRGRVRWWGLLPVLTAVLLIPFAPRADILISDSGKLFAIRGDDGVLYLSSRRADKFTRQTWMEREGQAGYDFFPTEKEEGGPRFPLSCDQSVCQGRRHGHLVSFIKNETALDRECAVTDIVISSFPVKQENCQHPRLLLDPDTWKNKGALALYFNADGSVAAKSAYIEQGIRPWSLRNNTNYVN